MTFDKFFSQFNGQSNVGNTAENRGECVGLVAVWIDVLGYAHVWGHAKDLFANAPESDFAKILNTPDAIAQKGDIVVWGQGYNGSWGHTGIATGKGDLNKFECFQQNDPLGSNCHLKTYSYAYVIGWLRPRNLPTDTHADDLTKMLNWDTLIEGLNSENYFDPKLDKLDKQGGSIVLTKFEELRRTLTETNKALQEARTPLDKEPEVLSSPLTEHPTGNVTFDGADNGAGGNSNLPDRTPANPIGTDPSGMVNLSSILQKGLQLCKKAALVLRHFVEKTLSYIINQIKKR